MPVRRRSEALVLIVLFVGIVLHFLPPVPSGRPAPAGTDAVSQSSPVVLALYDLSEEHAVQRDLPNRLREVSGLAMTTDHRLLAHNDEVGLISELDLETGAVRSTFAIVDGGAPIAADFEDIAVLEGRIYLATSDGVLYACPEGADGGQVACEKYATGLGAEYELESVGSVASRRELILVSKNPRSATLRERVVIDRWSVERRQLVAGGRVTVPFAAFARYLDEDQFQPSGVEVDATTGHYLIVAGPQRAVAEVTPEGVVLAVMRLPRRLHFQPEGIAFGADGSLLIADEGDGGPARLTIYGRRD